MADLSASIAKAKQAGYSDAEITKYLAADPSFGPKVKTAIDAGYGDAEIIGHLTKAPGGRKDGDQSFMRKLDAGVRGAADMLTLGFADEGAAAADATIDALKGEKWSDAYGRNLTKQRGIDASDKADVPASRGAGQVAGFGAGLAGGAVIDAGRVLPNAFRTGGGVVGDVLRGIGTGAAFGGISSAGAGDGDLGQRAKDAVPGAVAGGIAGGVLAPVVAGIGAGVNAFGRRNAPALDRAANALRGRTNVPEATERANAFRTAGAEPSFASATDEAGRGYVRAAASRQTPAREIVQQRAEAAALNLPDRISKQVRTHVSETPHSADDVINALEEARGTEARTKYAEPYSQTINITPRVVSALSGREGRAAIDSAIKTAEARRDTAALVDLKVLQKAVGGGAIEGKAVNPYYTLGTTEPPLPPVSGAALDRVQIELGRRARNLTRSIENPNPALAAGVKGRQGDINDSLDAFDGLQEARGAYKAATSNIEAVDAADSFLKPGSADAFGAVTAQASDLAPARAVAARRIEKAVGENPSAAPGVARRLSTAPEQQARNRALLGGETANAFETGVGAEARTVRDLNDVAPRTGSQTQLRTADQERASGLVGAVQTVAGGRTAIIGAVFNRLKTVGLSDRDAQAVAEISTDPAQLDALLQKIASGKNANPQMASAISDVVNQITGRTAGAIAAPQN